jgi:hypothetical protein
MIFKELKGNRSYGWGANPGRKASQQVQVVTDDPAIGPMSVLLAMGLEAGQPYREPLEAPQRYDYGLFLTDVDVAETADDGRQWVATLTYSQSDWKQQQGEGAQASAFIANPLEAPPSVRWSTESREEAVTLDRNGTPVLNSAGDPMDPTITRTVSNPVVTIERMLPAFDPDLILTYKDRVNSSAWMGYPAGTVLCKDITADRVFDADWGYMWRQSLVFSIKPIIVAESPDPDAPWQTDTDVISPGHAVQALDAGKRHRKDGKLEQIMIDDAPVSDPVYLQEDGTYDPEGDPHYLVFDVFDEAEFADLNLPADLLSASGGGGQAGGV